MKLLLRAGSVIVLTLCVVIGGTAFADPVIPFDPVTGLGGVLSQFMDKSAFYTPAGGIADPRLGVPLLGGEEGRSILYGTNLFANELPGLDNTTGIIPAFWTPSGSGEEMTALVYDFIIPGSVAGHPGQIVELGGAGYVATGIPSGVMPGGYLYLIGGKMDVYIDTSPDFSFLPAPAAWVPDFPVAGTDHFPMATTFGDAGASLWLTGTAVPLISDAGLGTTQELMPGEVPVAYWDPSGDTTTLLGVITDPSGDDIAITEVITSYMPGTGGGTSHGWFDITGGSLFPIIANDIMDPLGVSASDYDLYFESIIGPEGATSPWPVNSSDPVIFAITPEPASMVLFGTAMFGAVAAYRKRKK